MFTQTAGLRDREYAKFEAVQAGSLVAVNISNPIKRYIFSPSDLTADAKSGLVSTYSSYALNGEIKRITVDIGDWDATGSLWLKESGTSIQTPLLSIISGTRGFGGEMPFYPAEYTSYTDNTAGDETASQIGSPNAMRPLIVTEKVLLIASGLGVGNSGLGIYIDYR